MSASRPTRRIPTRAGRGKRFARNCCESSVTVHRSEDTPAHRSCLARGWGVRGDTDGDPARDRPRAYLRACHPDLDRLVREVLERRCVSLSGRAPGYPGAPPRNPACGFAAPGSSDQPTHSGLPPERLGHGTGPLSARRAPPRRRADPSAPSLHGHYPASPVVWADPTSPRPHVRAWDCLALAPPVRGPGRREDLPGSGRFPALHADG